MIDGRLRPRRSTTDLKHREVSHGLWRPAGSRRRGGNTHPPTAPPPYAMIPQQSASIPAVPAAAVGRGGLEIARCSAAVLVGVLGSVAAVLSWRRVAGALHEPLEPPLLLGTAAMVAAVALAIRLLRRSLATDQQRSVPLDRLFAWGPTAAVLVIAAALSRLDAPLSVQIGFWAILGAGECLAWRPAVIRSLSGRARVVPGAAGLSVDRSRASSPAAVLAEPLLDALASPDRPDDHLTQQLLRGRAADGSEVLSGWVRVGLARGQRTAAVHVAFCPPFSALPSLEVAQIDGPPSRIKTVQLLPYGARFDIKLSSDAAEPQTVCLRFEARA